MSHFFCCRSAFVCLYTKNYKCECKCEQLPSFCSNGKEEDLQHSSFLKRNIESNLITKILKNLELFRSSFHIQHRPICLMV